MWQQGWIERSPESWLDVAVSGAAILKQGWSWSLRSGIYGNHGVLMGFHLQANSFRTEQNPSLTAFLWQFLGQWHNATPTFRRRESTKSWLFTLDDLVSSSGRGGHYVISGSRPALAFALFPIRWGTEVLPRLACKRPQREDDHSPPSTVDVKGAWSITFTAFIHFHGRDNFTFY